ncbi:MAG: hypothetical protein NC410_09075 [Oscillibacter sp.]|nr:hypothetical protein [Oscillibacter sp.]
MNKQIALSIEQMDHLKELGVDTSDASLCWIKKPNTDNYSLSIHDESCYEMSCLHPVPAYTLQDILEKLPHTIVAPLKIYTLLIYDFDWWMYDGIGKELKLANGKTWLDTAYNMLYWVVENYPEFLKGGNQ